jgi:quercetin dioxygenase-like cupin family protein
LVVIEVDLLPGNGHAFHLHARQEELLYVLEGEVEQWLGEEKRILGAGDSTLIEPNTVHASFNISSKPAKVLAILGPVVGEEGYEVVEVAHQAPWNTLRKAKS